MRSTVVSASNRERASDRAGQLLNLAHAAEDVNRTGNLGGLFP
jgi:hypothetical protein